MNTIILYSTGCPRCKVLKKKLDAKGIVYTLEENEDPSFMIEKGFTETPILEVDGRAMGFIEANTWANQF